MSPRSDSISETPWIQAVVDPPIPLSPVVAVLAGRSVRQICLALLGPKQCLGRKQLGEKMFQLGIHYEFYIGFTAKDSAGPPGREVPGDRCLVLVPRLERESGDPHSL